MSILFTLLKRILSVFRKDRHLEELQEEMDFHVNARAEHYVKSGMSSSDAFKAAHRDFGNSLHIREQSWSQWAFAFEDELVQDIRYGCRALIHGKAWTLVAAFSLALGIGGTTAIFSVFDALVVKSLPVNDPERLFVLRDGVSYRSFQFLSDARVFADSFATDGTTEQDVESEDGLHELVPLSLVSGSYFSTLGISAAIGRTFTRDDDQSPANEVAVLSYGYWQRRFARSSDVVGKSLRINGTPVTIIGVTPPEFFGERVGTVTDMSLPITMWPRIIPDRNLLERPGTARLKMIGRLPANASVSGSEATLTLLYRRVLNEIFPNAPEDTRQEIARATVTLLPASNGVSELRDRFSGSLQVVFGLVVLLLLIACANVANLLLARETDRRREVALRLALGVSRPRLVRQLLAENLLLSALSTVFGLAIAWWGKGLLLRLASSDGLPIALNATLDARVLAFAVSLAAATAIVFGLAPMYQTIRLDLLTSLRAGTHQSSRRAGLTSSLVTIQVAVSLVLLVGAGLFVKTLQNLRTADLGFEPAQLVTLDVNPRAGGHVQQAAADFSRVLLEGLRNVPGVSSVTYSENGIFMDRDAGTNRMRPANFVVGPSGIPHSDFDVVGPEYFATMGIPLLAGRDIQQTDDRSSTRVVVINESMAHRFFPNVNPIGQIMNWRVDGGYEVIAVAPNVKQRSVRDEADLRFYVAALQQPVSELDARAPSIRYDAVALSVAAGVVFLVSAFAAYLPARRAARVNPCVALRHD